MTEENFHRLSSFQNFEMETLEQDSFTRAKTYHHKHNKLEETNLQEEIFHIEVKQDLPSSLDWKVLALISAVSFAVANSLISEISHNGAASFLYYSFGTFFCSSVYFLRKMLQTKRETRSYFKGDFYFIDRFFAASLTRIRWDKLFGILGMTALFFGNTMLIMLNFKLARMAMINTGVISIVWSISPFITSVLDYLWHRQKLVPHQYMGMAFILLCAMLVGLKSLIYHDEEIDENSASWVSEELRISSYIPVFLAFAVATSFSFDAMATKYCVNTLNLPPTDLGFLTQGIASTIGVFIAIILWSTNHLEFSTYDFFIGSLSSIVVTLGIICSFNAFSKGPAGPV